MQSARWFLKLAPDDAKPYIALTMIAVLPLFSPNLVPSVVCTFSEHGAVRYGFCIADVRSFNAAKVRAILTDSLETTAQLGFFPNSHKHLLILFLAPIKFLLGLLKKH